MKNLIIHLVALTFIYLLPHPSDAGAQSHAMVNYRQSLISIISRLDIDTAHLIFVIDKSDYRLSVMCDTVILKQYPVVFGKNPVDDKLKQGDKCTPEGIFFMRAKYPHNKWSKFIWINYPTTDSWRKHNDAVSRGLIPDTSRIGGEIGIHGVPPDMDYLIDFRYNWTEGCISLKNRDLEEIFIYITKTTPIVIRK